MSIIRASQIILMNLDESQSNFYYDFMRLVFHSRMTSRTESYDQSQRVVRLSTTGSNHRKTYADRCQLIPIFLRLAMTSRITSADFIMTSLRLLMIGYDRLMTGADHMTKAYKYRVQPCNKEKIMSVKAKELNISLAELKGQLTSMQNMFGKLS